MRRRFFIDQFKDGRAVLAGDAAYHLGRVLRAHAGQQYELSDGLQVWLGQIERVGPQAVEFRLLEELEAREPALRLTLFLAVVKFDSFEWAIEKATELGVGRIVPLAAARSDKALVLAAAKRSERWKKLVLEAAQQSRRVAVPVLRPPAKPEAAFAAAGDGLKVLLSEQKEAQAMKSALGGKSATDVTVAIGPEGGWTEEEFAHARQAGFLEASMGRLILRTETAVVAALAALNYALGGDPGVD